MALYDIEHSCGHTEETQIYGTNVNGERERRAEYLESLPCRRCRRERLDRERAAESRAAAEHADARGWPKLTGTEKQVAWAATIRRRTVEEVGEELARDARRRERGDAAAAKRAVEAAALRRTRASWWIDRRDTVPEGRQPDRARTALLKDLDPEELAVLEAAMNADTPAENSTEDAT